MTGITLNHYIALSGILFMMGLSGVMLRRSVLSIYMCLEMMLNASILALVAFGRFEHNLNAHILVFFIITVAAAEVAVGLALIVAIYRLRQTTNVNDFTLLKF
jgi:NADH-quinone oxidoreductase subunit K